MLVDKVKSLEDVCIYELCSYSNVNFDCILGSKKNYENKCELDSIEIASAPKITFVKKKKKEKEDIFFSSIC